MRTWRRWTVWTAATLLVTAVFAAATLPWWAPALARHLAATRGVTISDLQLGYPGLSGVRIARLAAHTETATLLASGIDVRYSMALRGAGHRERITLAQLRALTATADVSVTDVDLTYDLAGLGDGRVDSVDIGRLVVTLLPAPTAQTTPLPKLPEALWRLVPLRAATVRALQVQGARPDFAVHGSLRFDQHQLQATLAGLRPVLAAGTRATLLLTRAGHLTMQLGRSQAPTALPGHAGAGATGPASAAANANAFVAATVRAGAVAAARAGEHVAARADIDALLDSSGRQMTVKVDALLPVDLLSLISAPLGISTTRGALAAQLHARLPWPLPDQFDAAALRELADAADAQGTFALDWSGALPDRITAATTRLRGNVRAGGGSVTVQLTPGTVLTGQLVMATPLQLFGQTIAPLATLRADQAVTIDLTSRLLRVTGGAEARIGNPRATLRADIDALRMPLSDAGSPAKGTAGDHRPAALGDGLTARVRWQADLAKTSFGRFKSAGTTTVALAGGIATLQIAPKMTLELAKLGDWSQSPTTATNPAAFTVRVDSGTLHYRASDMAFALQLPKAAFDDVSVAFRPSTLTVAQVDGRGADLVTTGALATHVTVDQHALAFDIAGTIRLKNDVAQLALTLAVPKSALKAPFTVRHDLASGGGALHLDATIVPDRALLHSVLDRWREEYDLDRGQVKLLADLSWRVVAGTTQLTGAGNFATHDVQAHYADYLLRGANVRADWQLDARGFGVTNGKATIAEAFVGAAITAISAPFAYHDGVLSSPGVRAEVAGGRIATTPVQYTSKDGAAQFEMRVEGVALDKLLALEGGDIEGSGTLDGTLPVRLVNNTPTIQNGVVTARPPGGRIAYAAAGQIAEYARGPGLDFAFTALQDFRYDTLTAAVEYAQDSNMKLAVRLHGRNPAIEGGRAIHYNLNINENVADLLRSLRASTDVSDRFAKRLSQ